MDKRGFVGSVPMDLSKTYDSLLHNLLLAKFPVYSFSKGSIIKFLLGHIKDGMPRIQIGLTFSHWIYIVRGILQSSMLDP